MTDKAKPSIFVDDFRIVLAMCRIFSQGFGEEPSLPSTIPKYVARRIFGQIATQRDACREMSKDIESAVRRMFSDGSRLERELAEERARTKSLTEELARCKTPL